VELSWDEIRRELADSKSQIEQSLGKVATLFSYPFAFPQHDDAFVARFRDLLEAIGYQSCVTTCIGRVDAQYDSYSLPRLPANSADDASLLAAKLNGDYDWMRLPQLLRKKSKRHPVRPKEVKTVSLTS
jgi:hypothetical protein